MKVFLLSLAFACALSVANATGLLTAAAVIIGAKILIGKGLAVGYLASRAGRGRFGGRGSRRRFGRDTEDVSVAFLEASRKDQFDCAKFLVCSLNAIPKTKLQEEELLIASTFGQGAAIDVTLPSVEFDVAAFMGRLAGPKQCSTIYSRCPMNVPDIMSEIRKAAYAY